jgi:tetratricopeptide (TPR) repeat protein
VEADFEISERLESWHMIDEAVTFAERGARLAGDDLFTSSWSAQAQSYARIMTEARHYDAVLDRVGATVKDRADVTQAVGAVVAELYTPEDEAAFENALVTRGARMSREARDSTLMPLATSSRLVDLETRWRFDSMTQSPQGWDSRFVSLETERARFHELAQELEQYASQRTAMSDTALVQTIDAQIAEGDVDGQMRLMEQLVRHNALDGVLLDRYLSLLAKLHPDRLVALAEGAPSEAIRNRAVQWAIGSGNRDLAYRAVRARGAQLKPVWARAYVALTGVYYEDAASTINAAFAGALDTRTIGERISSPPDRDATLAGSVWFYYGARYGEYLDRQKSAKATDYLAASVEDAPGSPDQYIALGDYYESAHQPDKAIAQYALALQLDSDRGDAHDHTARVEWNAGRRDAAIANWRAAIAAFERIQSRGGRVEESFWPRLAQTFTDIGACHAVVPLRDDMQRLLVDYISRNGSYELDSLLNAAFEASLSSGEDPSWVLDLADRTDEAEYTISSLLGIPNLTASQRITLKRKRVAMMEHRLASLHGDERAAEQTQITGARLELIGLLLDQKLDEQELAEWNLLPTDIRNGTTANPDPPVEIRLAARTGTLAGVLKRYRSKPETAPGVEQLRSAAQALRRDKNESAALAVLDFLYTRELDAGRLDAANFIGLAEVRLEQDNAGTALQLLHRMALVTDKPFDTLLAAADLVEKYKQPEAAAEFVAMRLRAAPWDTVAKLHAARLAQGARRAELLTAALTDPLATYRDRADAARMIAPSAPASLAGTELGLLASGRIDPAAAGKPFYVEARVRAAEAAPDHSLRERLLREALAIAPADQRVRLGVLRAELGLRRDSIALALVPQPERRWSGGPSFLPEPALSNEDRASLAEQLSAAAERLDDLKVAATYLSTAIDLLPEDRAGPDERKLKAITAEQTRRTANATRQPVIRNVVEQEQVVRPEIPRSAR